MMGVWHREKFEIMFRLIFERAVMDYLNPSFYKQKKKVVDQFDPEYFFYEKYCDDVGNFPFICEYMGWNRKMLCHALEEHRREGRTYRDLFKPNRRRKVKKRKGYALRDKIHQLDKLYEILLAEGRVTKMKVAVKSKNRGKTNLEKVRSRIERDERTTAEERKERKEEGNLKYDVLRNKKTDKPYDLFLRFGKYTGYRLTELMEFPAGRNYVTSWLLSDDFEAPEDFKKWVRRFYNSYDGVVTRDPMSHIVDGDDSDHIVDDGDDSDDD